MSISAIRTINRSGICSFRSPMKSTLRANWLEGSVPSPSNKVLPTFRSNSSSRRLFSSPSITSELGCIQSLLPLHSAVASARLNSCLSVNSQSSRALSQELGLSVPR